MVEQVAIRLSDPAVVPTRYWHRLDNGEVQCDLCPRHCKLREGQRGLCFVRARVADQIVLTTYGRASGFCIDPIEKKPLNHFYPGSAVLSFGTAGCNLACKFCQNWDISKSREMATLANRASPSELARAAERLACQSVAYTYNDPVIFTEYALDVAAACRELGIFNVAVTAAYITPEARGDFFGAMDAANVDLKGFTDAFYWKLTGAHLKTVLDNLVWLKTHTACWLEITTLLIPGKNDSNRELAELSTWVRDNLGKAVPLHFTAFHPDYKFRDIAATPLATLQRARAIAQDVGLDFVYIGNAHDKAGSSTYCPACSALLIGRDWYALSDWHLDAAGNCAHCGTAIAGHFLAKPGGWGARRVPVRLVD